MARKIKVRIKNPSNKKIKKVTVTRNKPKTKPKTKKVRIKKGQMLT